MKNKTLLFLGLNRRWVQKGTAVAAGLALALSAVGAAAADVTLTADTTIPLATQGINLTVLSGSEATTLTVNAGNIVVEVPTGSHFAIQNTDRRVLTNNQSVTTSCQLTFSQLYITGPLTVTVTPESSGTCTITAAGSSGVVVGGGGGSSSTPATTPVTTPTTTPTTTAASQVASDAAQLAQTLGVPRDEAGESANAGKVGASASEFGVAVSDVAKTLGANFVTYGTTDATQKLGSGERLALVRDQLQTLGRVSLTALEQLASGQKPTDRNLPNEVAQLPQVLAAFERLVGHRPNFQNAQEDLAWNTMMYRVRFDRDLNKERVGISKFRSIFGSTPTSPLNWAVVRAWGYALQ